MLVSPAEPEPLRKIGTVSSMPERYGADFLLPSRTHGLVGVQRKELSDLVSSVQDGRLQREIAQMKSLGQGIVVIEGVERWTNDGSAMWSSSWTVAQHRGLMWSVASRGLWIDRTTSLTDTISYLSLLTKWMAKERHTSLEHRPGPRASSLFGSVDSRDYALHLLQGIEGIGPGTAKKIYERFGLPVRWTISELDLMGIDGIGQNKAAKIIAAFGTIRAIDAE